MLKKLLGQKESPVVISYDNQEYPISSGESVLEALEKADIKVPYSCRAGVCHSCMMQGSGHIPEAAQKGLSASQVAQNFFLACSCYPEKNLQVSLKGNSDLSKAVVASKKLLNDSVLCLTLQVDFSWFPGQFITLWKDELTGRAYSIASRCDDKKQIELHIKKHDEGVVSRWLHDELGVNEEIMLSQATGDCFYTDNHHEKPILMACTGTGLAPLYGILQEALAQEHSAPIYLYAASGEPSGLYYREELELLSQNNININYNPVVRRNPEEGVAEGDLLEIIKEQHPDLNGYKVFICGAPEFVKALQRQCFFQGAKINDILVDAFETTQ